MERTKAGRIATFCLSILVGLGVAGAIFHLLSLVFLQGIDDAPYPIFFSMGRGILNGLIPYEDLFETKPPGLFLLSAASLAIFKNFILANIFQTILLIGVPILFTLFAWKKTRHQEKPDRFLAPALALLGSIALLRYLLPHPGVWSPDFYSAVFGMLYVLTIANDENKHVMLSGAERRRSMQQVLQILLPALFLFLAIGTKEPAFLATLAGATVILRTPKDFLRGYIIPLAIAAVAGFLTLLLLGWLKPYLSTYLPAMFGGYLVRHTLPLWQKGLAIDLTFANLATLSPFFPLLIIASCAFLLSKGKMVRAHFATLTTSVFLIFSIFFLLALTGPRLMFYTSQWMLGGILILLFVAAMQKWKTGKARNLLICFIFAVAALLLTSFEWCQYSSPLFLLVTNVLSIFPHGANLPCLGTFGVLGLLIIASLLLLIHNPLPGEDRELSLSLSLLLGVILLSYIGILIYFFLETPISASTPILPLLIVGGFAAYLFQKWDKPKKQIFLEVVRYSAALFLAIFAIALGTDFQNQHYLAATPFYAALLLAALSLLSAKSEKKEMNIARIGLLVLASLISFSSYPYPALSIREHKANIKATEDMRALAQESAKNLDAIMDACKIDRYYILKNEKVLNPFEGYTKHSPLNFFSFAGIETINTYHPNLSRREIRNILEAQLMIVSDYPPTITGGWVEDISYLIQEEFTMTPWPCAKDLPGILHRILLFRKVPGRTIPFSEEVFLEFMKSE